MATLGIIGSGNIGSAVARLAIAGGMNVAIANSRGPESLTELISTLGPSASAFTVEQVAEQVETVLISIPLCAMQQLPKHLFQDKLVLDTSNYYPSRDGRIAELDESAMTASALAQSWMPGARYVKAFNNILAHHIPLLARAEGEPFRSALPIASDDAEALTKASVLISRLGYDTVDSGRIAESWRFEPDAAAYTRMYLADPTVPGDQVMTADVRVTSADLVRATLESATRINVSERAF